MKIQNATKALSYSQDTPVYAHWCNDSPASEEAFIGPVTAPLSTQLTLVLLLWLPMLGLAGRNDWLLRHHTHDPTSLQ